MAEGKPGPELRWFFAADDPRTALVKGWIEGAVRDVRVTAQTGPETREDFYVVPTLANVGQKQRGLGGLEVKLRLGTEPFAWGGMVGRIERWIKLEPDALTDDALARVRWYGVPKVRRLVKWADARKGFVPAFVRIDGAGCGVEFTELPRHAQISLGFEAFGPADQAEAALHAAIDRLAAELPDLTLAAAESLGYPEWLSRVA